MSRHLNLFAPDTIPNGRCYLGFRDEALYWVRKMEEAGVDIACLGITALKYFCSFLIHETADRNPDFVREPVLMLTITQNSGVVMVPSDEISAIVGDMKGTSVVDRVKRKLLKAEN